MYRFIKKFIAFAIVLAMILGMAPPVNAAPVTEGFETWGLIFGDPASPIFEHDPWRFEARNDAQPDSEPNAAERAVTQDDEWYCFGISSADDVDDFRIINTSGTKFSFISFNIIGWSDGSFILTGWRDGEKVTGDVNVSYTYTIDNYPCEELIIENLTADTGFNYVDEVRFVGTDGEKLDIILDSFTYDIPVPDISVGDASVNEDAGNAAFTVTLSPTYDGIITLDYTTNDGTAKTLDNDYSSVSGTLTIPANTASATITVPINEDAYYEGSESFYLTIDNASLGSITDNQGVCTITDNDNEPSVSLGVSAASFSENGGTAQVTASLSNRSFQDVTVALGFSGSASESDYTSSAASIVIAAGAMSGSTTLAAVNDETIEASENITVSITTVTNGTENGEQQVTTSIIDDDVAPSVTIVAGTTAGGDALVNSAEKASGFNVIAKSSKASGSLYVVPSGTADNIGAITGASIGSTASAGANADTTISIAADNIGVTDGISYCVYAVDGGGNISAISGIAFTADLTPPPAPEDLDMQAASDTGSSNTDNITSDTTPTFEGTAEAGSTVTLISSINGSVGTATAAGGSWTITASALSGGTHNITAVATDAAGNTSVSSGVLTIKIDTSAPTAPTVTMSSNNPDSAYAKVGDTITLSIITDEEIQSPAVTIAGNAASINNAGDADAKTWSAAYTMQEGDASGSVAFTLNFTDIAGNNATQVASVTAGSAVTFDKTAPTVEITSVASNITNDSSIPITITFSEAVTGFIPEDITVANGTAGNFNAVSDSTYTADITPSGQGAVTVDINAGVANDAAGNGNIAAAQISRTYDSVAPVVDDSNSNTVYNTTTHKLAVKITETVDIQAVDVEKFTVKKGGQSRTLTSDSTAVISDSSTVTITIDGDDLTAVQGFDGGEGIDTVSVSAGGVTDAAGNSNLEDTDNSVSTDLPPVLESASRTDNTHITVTLSEGCAGIAKGNDGGFTVEETGSGTPYTVSSISQGEDASHVILTVADMAVSAKEGVTVKYTSGENGTVSDLTGNTMATNNTGVTAAGWDIASPTIESASVSSDNKYIDITFNEGIYGADDGLTALSAGKLALTFTKNSGTATNVQIHSIKKNDSTIEASASALTGGETVVRVFLTVTGTPNGAERIQIKAADGSSIYDKAGNAASGDLSTLSIALNDQTPPPPPPAPDPDPTPAPTPTPPPASGVNVIVNGQVQQAATAATTKEGDKTVTTITVDDKKIEEKLEQEGKNSTVVIPVNDKSDVVVGELNGQTVKNMETKEAVLEIRTENVTYTLPASQINIDNVSSLIGKEVELKDIKVNVKISEPPADTVKIVENTASKNSYQVVVKPVEFDITCTSGDKTVEVSKFNGYVERTVAVPDGIDPSKITTGIVLNPDGTFSHVPTTIVIIDGKYYAKINSLTNSTYSVIWNPKTYNDLEGHWGMNDAADMASRLIMDGVDTDSFAPDEDISRGEFIVTVIKALGLMRTGAGYDVFSDVKSDSPYYDAASIAYDYKITTGCGNGVLLPDQSISREEAMTIIARAMAVAKLDIEVSDENVNSILESFTDGHEISSWSRKAAAACIKNEIFFGYGKQIMSGSTISRVQTAAIVRRMLIKANLI